MSDFHPVINERAPGLYYPEVCFAQGPQQIGGTGDSSMQTLFGREWALEAKRLDNHLHLYQWQPGSGQWLEVTSGLPDTLFGQPMPDGARRWSATFDQSARVIVAYEENGTIKATRWDTSQNAYAQNVSFAGVDPQIFMDALVAYPLPPDLQAYRDTGNTVQLELAGTGQVVDNSMLPVSDLIIFYLTNDRERVAYRRQGENYATEHILFEASEPLILDHVTALTGRYQLLISNAQGAQLDAAEVLVSDDYIVTYIYFYRPTESLSVQASGPVAGTLESVILLENAQQALTTEAVGPIGGLLASVILNYSSKEALTASAQGPVGGELVSAVTNESGGEALTANAQGPVEGELKHVVVNAPPQTDSLTAAAQGPLGGTLKHVNAP